jgi:hypothetical protein
MMEEVISLRNIVSTFVNVTMYSQYNMIIESFPEKDFKIKSVK